MRFLTLAFMLSFSLSALAQKMTIDMKLAEVNPDGTQARFFKGEPAYGLSDAMGSVHCWKEDGNRFALSIEDTGKLYSADFATYEDCMKLIKKAKGFLGLNYGTIRFVFDVKTKKMISTERI